MSEKCFTCDNQTEIEMWLPPEELPSRPDLKWGVSDWIPICEKCADDFGVGDKWRLEKLRYERENRKHDHQDRGMAE